MDEDQSNPRHIPLMLCPSGSSAKANSRWIIYSTCFYWYLKWILLEELNTEKYNFVICQKEHIRLSEGNLQSSTVLPVLTIVGGLLKNLGVMRR